MTGSAVLSIRIEALAVEESGIASSITVFSHHFLEDLV